MLSLQIGHFCYLCIQSFKHFEWNTWFLLHGNWTTFYEMVLFVWILVSLSSLFSLSIFLFSSIFLFYGFSYISFPSNSSKHTTHIFKSALKCSGLNSFWDLLIKSKILVTLLFFYDTVLTMGLGAYPGTLSKEVIVILSKTKSDLPLIMLKIYIIKMHRNMPNIIRRKACMM